MERLSQFHQVTRLGSVEILDLGAFPGDSCESGSRYRTAVFEPRPEAASRSHCPCRSVSSH
jgi:hypothetical protein